MSTFQPSFPHKTLRYQHGTRDIQNYIFPHSCIPSECQLTRHHNLILHHDVFICAGGPPLTENRPPRTDQWFGRIIPACIWWPTPYRKSFWSGWKSDEEMFDVATLGVCDIVNGEVRPNRSLLLWRSGRRCRRWRFDNRPTRISG